MRIASGLMVSRWPTTIGVMILASTRCRLMKTAGGSSAAQASGKVISPPRNSSSADGDRAEVGDVVEHRDDAAPHHRRGHPELPQDQRGQRAEADVDEGDRAEIGRGRVDHLLDHPRRGQRALEAAAADDRLLAHRGPAGEEEEDHQQREEELDQQVRRRCGEQAEHRVGSLDADRPRSFLAADRDLRQRPVDEPVEVLVEVEHRLERGADLGRSSAAPAPPSRSPG